MQLEKINSLTQSKSPRSCSIFKAVNNFKMVIRPRRISISSTDFKGPKRLINQLTRLRRLQIFIRSFQGNSLAVVCKEEVKTLNSSGCNWRRWSQQGRRWTTGPTSEKRCWTQTSWAFHNCIILSAQRGALYVTMSHLSAAPTQFSLNPKKQCLSVAQNYSYIPNATPDNSMLAAGIFKAPVSLFHIWAYLRP